MHISPRPRRGRPSIRGVEVGTFGGVPATSPAGGVAPGGRIVADNVYRSGAIGGPEAGDDAALAGLRAYTRAALNHPLLTGTLLTVGDGVAMDVILRRGRRAAAGIPSRTRSSSSAVAWQATSR